MKVKNLYVGKIVEVKEANAVYHYGNTAKNHFAKVTLAPVTSKYNKCYIRLSLFNKKKDKMYDIMYGGRYDCTLDTDNLEYDLKNKTIQYVDNYKCISNFFNSKSVSKHKLIKKYKESFYNYNKNGGKNE